MCRRGAVFSVCSRVRGERPHPVSWSDRFGYTAHWDATGLVEGRPKSGSPLRGDGLGLTDARYPSAPGGQVSQLPYPPTERIRHTERCPA